VNHFGHFLMINLLMKNILSSEREIVLNGKSTVFKPRITVLGTVTAIIQNLEEGSPFLPQLIREIYLDSKMVFYLQ